jgi:amidase
MSWQEWGDHDGVALAAAIKRGELTAGEAAYQAASAIALLNPRLDAVLETFADMVDEPGKEGSRCEGSLYGVPMLLKDLAAGLAGRKQEQGSRLFKDYVPAWTDPIVENFLQAGLVPIGRSATPEFGLAWDTTTNYLGSVISTRNPWNVERSAGGSSGGAAAAVAAGMVPIGSSSDGGGSTRIPASLCGLVGLKPSRGLLPRPRHSSEYLSRISTDGVVTRSVRDTAGVLDYAARVPLGGSFISMRRFDQSYAGAIEHEPKPLRIGLCTGHWGRVPAVLPTIAERIEKLGDQLSSFGHLVREVDDTMICNWDEMWESYTINWIANRAMLPQIAGSQGIAPEQLQDYLTPMTWRMYEASSAYDKFDLWRSMAMNNRLTRAFGSFFSQYDVLLAPAYASVAPLANGSSSLLSGKTLDEWFGQQLDASRYAIPANEVGLPSIALPTGLDEHGMPVGAQFYGRWGDEATLLQLAAQIETAHPAWFGMAPPVHVTRSSVAG